MAFRLKFSAVAEGQLTALETDPTKLKRVRKCLGQLQVNPRHSGLNSHKYESLKGENGEDVWESYVENRTPAAWRVFWHYGPRKEEITVVAVTPHP